MNNRPDYINIPHLIKNDIFFFNSQFYNNDINFFFKSKRHPSASGHLKMVNLRA